MPTNLSYFDRRQLEIVEFSEQVYHAGLRHKGINGSLYEDFFINYLREDVKDLKFYKGEIKTEKPTESSQYDIIICKPVTKIASFLIPVTSFVNIVEEKNVLGVIEIKKWCHPKMIETDGIINKSYYTFKSKFPNLKYFFLTFRYKDRVKINKRNWHQINTQLLADNKFCLFGNTNDSFKEWEFPWMDDCFENHQPYLGQYQKLIEVINNLSLPSNK